MGTLVKVISKICFAQKIYKNESTFLGTMYIDEVDYMTVAYGSRISSCKTIQGENKYCRNGGCFNL
jgi:hypothetical protein